MKAAIAYEVLYFFEDLLQSDSHLAKKNCFIYFNQSPLKIMKNAFYFILKVWTCRRNSLIRKLNLISKFMTSQPG